jgi:hypothetical protein
MQSLGFFSIMVISFFCTNQPLIPQYTVYMYTLPAKYIFSMRPHSSFCLYYGDFNYFIYPQVLVSCSARILPQGT